ncbi:hypothetical protein ACYCCF_03695 [Streptomyces argenteolus]|uniref:hypothetical protein n=1 Tax=Streptomyces sp. NPDC025273 TaxID=3155251 RepID=UPI00340AF108
MRGHQGRTPVEHLGISPLRLAKVRAPASRPGWWPGVLTGTPRPGPARQEHVPGWQARFTWRAGAVALRDDRATRHRAEHGRGPVPQGDRPR